MVKNSSRRQFIKNGGKVLALPYFASLAPKALANAERPKRFAVFYYPNGVPHRFWQPQGSGVDFELSAILEPLTPFKHLVNVYSELENYSSAGTSTSVEPSHSRLAGAFLTCQNSDALRAEKGLPETGLYNGISIDQILAQSIGSNTLIPSIQTGLSTGYYFTDYRHGSLSRSISWADEKTPLYKIISPKALFQRLYGQENLAETKSVIDFALKDIQSLENHLAAADRAILDQYLTSLREVELELDLQKDKAPLCPSELKSEDLKSYLVGEDNPGYNRREHALMMNRLLALSFQCDHTRIFTHMLDDSRSDFSYDHLEVMNFTKDALFQPGQRVSNYHSSQHLAERINEYATIAYEMISVISDFCHKLAQIPTADGNVLEETVILAGSDMHGPNHSGKNLPVLTIGHGNGAFKTGQHIDFSGSLEKERPLSDLYLTLLNHGFGLGLNQVGTNSLAKPPRLIEEIIA